MSLLTVDRIKHVCRTWYTPSTSVGYIVGGLMVVFSLLGLRKTGRDCSSKKNPSILVAVIPRCQKAFSTLASLLLRFAAFLYYQFSDADAVLPCPANNEPSEVFGN